MRPTTVGQYIAARRYAKCSPKCVSLVILSKCLALFFSLSGVREKWGKQHLQGKVSRLFCDSNLRVPASNYSPLPVSPFCTPETMRPNVREESNDQVPKLYPAIPSPDLHIFFSPTERKGVVGGRE